MLARRHQGYAVPPDIPARARAALKHEYKSPWRVGLALFIGWIWYFSSGTIANISCDIQDPFIVTGNAAIISVTEPTIRSSGKVAPLRYSADGSATQISG